MFGWGRDFGKALEAHLLQKVPNLLYSKLNPKQKQTPYNIISLYQPQDPSLYCIRPHFLTLSQKRDNTFIFTLIAKTTMQRCMPNASEPQKKFTTMIEEVIVVGLSDNCQSIPSINDLKWITSLQIVTQQQFQEQILENNFNTKFVQLGNEYYLKMFFCQKDKKPITKIKCSRRLSNPEMFALNYPCQSPQEQHLYYMRNDQYDGRLIIADVQAMEVNDDNELDLPQQTSYEIIRLPSACQKAQKEEYSNSEEHMITKTKYLIIKTLDLQDQEHHHVQKFSPRVIYQHSMKNKSILIDYSSFHKFCFPQGVILHKDYRGYGYSIYNFILTQQDGTRIYVNCLKFKEKLDHSILQTLPFNCIDRHIHKHGILYTQKTVCLLSKHCYTQFFHNLLEQLFRKFHTEQSRFGISKYQSKNEILKEIQFQPILFDFVEKYQMGFREGEKKFYECEYLQESIKIQMDWDQGKIIFPEPQLQHQSFYSPKAVHCLFKMLTVDKIMDIVESLLLEKTIIFVSNSQVALGYAIESLVSFLYPLRWENIILPLLPIDMLNLLQAPMPIIAGVPQSLATDDLIHQLKQDSIVVFLDCNDILHKQHDNCHINHIKQATKKLRTYDIYVKHHVDNMLQFRDQFYLFKIHQKQQQHHFCSQHIKHILFQTILKLIHNYSAFYRKDNKVQPHSCSPLKAHQASKKRAFNFKKDYALDQFIRSHPKNNTKFMRKFTQTSHFISFLYNYEDDANNNNKLFIDSAIKRQNSNNKIDLPNFETRYSEQHYSTLEANSLRKKTSWPNNVHNITWSPQPKKMDELSSTNNTRTFERNSLKLEEVERQKSMSEDRRRSTPGSNICEVINRAMDHVSKTKNNLFMWTKARVQRLKKEIVGHKQKQNQQEEQPRDDKNDKVEVVSIKMVRQQVIESDQPQKKAH